MDLTTRTLFSRCEIPEDFLCDVIRCAKFFKKFQETAILRNLALYNMPEDGRALSQLKHRIALNYLKMCRLKKITRSQQLIAVDQPLVAQWKLGSGFQSNRSSLPRLSTCTQSDWMKLKAELSDINARVNDTGSREWVPPENWKDSVNLVPGKRYYQIQNSKFCYSRILNIFLFVMENNTMNDAEEVTEILQFHKQRAVLDSFLLTISSLEEGQDFVIRNNTPILSRFSVSSVWLIAHLFSKVLQISTMISFFRMYNADGFLSLLFFSSQHLGGVEFGRWPFHQTDWLSQQNRDCPVSTRIR